MEKTTRKIPAAKKESHVILEAMSDGIFEITSDEKIVFANSAAVSLCNIPKKKLLGSIFTRLFSGDAARIVADILKAPRKKLETLTADSPLVLNEYLVKIKILFGETQEDTRIVFLSDITEHERVREIIRLRNREQRLHTQTVQAFNSSLNLDQVIVSVLEEVRRLMGVLGSSIWLIDKYTGELVCEQATGDYGETLRGWRLAPGEGLAGWVVQHGESSITPDTYSDQRHYKEVDQAIGKNTQSILTVPLYVKGDIIGVLQVVDIETGRFDKNHLALMETLAGSAAIAIENARLYEKAKQEISIRKQAEEALRESENKYRTVLEANPDSVIVYDMEGKVTYFNPTFTKVFGWTLTECLGKKMDMFVPEENWPETHEMIEKVLAGEKLTGIETFRYTKSGDVVPVSISGAIYHDRDGKPVGSVVNLRNIYEQKKLEAQIHQVQKLEAIGTLAGGIAHDYNNLLMGILGNASLVTFDLDSKHPHYEKLKNIEKYVQSGADLTKQLLGFAKGGKYEVKPIDINEVVEQSSEMFSRTKKEIRIHRNLQKNIWSVEADPNQVEQVLLNLYVNAGQAMPGGGDLYLQTENLTLGDRYTRHFSVKAGNFVKISITDTGTGMDEKTIKRIFDPFFTTKDMGRGTGLGLASAYGIIKNHGGIINADSVIDKGTTFNVFLPASEKNIVKIQPLNQTMLKGVGTVLLVDDEEMIIDVGSQILENLGYSVLSARSGKEAIDLYQGHQDKIILVILDMVMPDLGGGETFDCLKKIDPEIKILLSSGYSINGEASEIMDRGCNGFIQKPFNIKQLSRKIRDVLD
jgi:PAS domain S-box-containing protein